MQYLKALGVVLFTTAICFPFRSRVNPTSIAMVLLLGVVIVASRFDRGPAVNQDFVKTRVLNRIQSRG
jgi:K+-sensing histidine kinase KdpD